MSASKTNDSKEIDNPKTLDEIKKNLDRVHTNYEPANILREAGAKLNSSKDEDDEDGEYDNEDERPSSFEDPVVKAMTLSEFKNGVLLTISVEEQYKTFGIDMLRKLQEEYQCLTISEQAIAELVTISYIRTLAIQRRINNYLAMGTLTDNGVKFLAIMSKELDRAHRHFLTATQTLRMIKQPSFSVNVKTNTAIVGQNQLIQENQNVKPI